jgi:hypothetical protein
MKNYILSITMFCSLLSFGQNITDAMRFSQSDLSGTARFNAMSGAFGALGGDLSAINLNPAGSTVFANNQAGFTLRSFNLNNNVNYFGTKNTEIQSSLDINQAGAVFVFESDEKSDWSKLALAINYESVNNLDNSVFSTGTNRNSVANYFTSYANGIPLDYISNYNFEDLTYNEQQAYLGYQSYIINPAVDSNANTVYYSAVPAGANYYQEHEFTSKGFNGKLVLNGAVQYKDLFSVGLNINTHFVDYTQTTSFYERNDYTNSTTDYLVKRIRFNNQLYTYGSGFSLQVGTIIKPTKEIRLGLSYQTPTWYKLNDELTQNSTSVSGNVNGELAPDVVDPQVTMVYEPYKIRSAGNFSGSFAYVFNKKGLISFDYILKNHEGIKLSPNSDFSDENAYIATVLKNSAEYRIGGEYKIQKFSLRGGYRFDESPYKNGRTIGDLTGYSGGVGYNFGKTKLDLAYSYSQRFYDQQFFSQGLTDYSTVNTKNHNISVSLLFEL